MGIDIHGWVEFRSHDAWWGTIDVGNILPRNTAMFESLFGVRNVYGFKPVASKRGIPDDASDLVIEKFLEYDDNRYPSWITYEEVKGVEWNEEIVSIQICRYGAWYFHSTPRTIRDMEWNEGGIGKRYEQDGHKYRFIKVKRQLFVDREWELVFKWMGDLVELYGEENVRLVVWFDE